MNATDAGRFVGGFIKSAVEAGVKDPAELEAIVCSCMIVLDKVTNATVTGSLASAVEMRSNPPIPAPPEDPSLSGWYEVCDMQDLRQEAVPRVRVRVTDGTVGNLGWFAVWGADMDQVLIAGVKSLIRPRSGGFRIDNKALKRWSIDEGTVDIKRRQGAPLD